MLQIEIQRWRPSKAYEDCIELLMDMHFGNRALAAALQIPDVY